MTGTVASFPDELSVLDPLEVSLAGGRLVAVPAWRAQFPASTARSSVGLDRSWSSKPLVMVEKQAMFPEIACLSLFQKAGWSGVWADRVHHRYYDKMPTQSKGVSLDTYANQLIGRIAENNGKSKAGCWDIILWQHRTLLFVAVTPEDAGPGLGDAGLGWLAAGLRTGLSSSQFALVRWGYRSVVVRRRRGNAG
jgi:hypothetical protein